MKKLSLMLSVFIAVILFATASFPTAYATTSATFTRTIELETRSALLVDRSGSMDDKNAVEQILSQYDIASFDEVVYFDTSISTDSNFTGGGNSSICEAIDKVATGGFTHITVVTDAEQWPADYSSLGVYSDLDITIHLVEETKDADKLIKEMENHLSNSGLKVVTPDGQENIILDEYKAPIYEIVLQNSEDEGDIYEGDTIINEGNDYICNCDCCKCNHKAWSWWWILLLLLPLLGILLWWFFRNWNIARKIRNSKAVVDCSNSMTKFLTRLYRACRRMGVSKDAEFVRFGEGASIEKLSFLKNVQGERCTHGTEGLELAIAQGWDEIVLISDLGFNGKSVSTLKGRFKKVSVVVPSGYSSATLDEVKKIADEVEVLHL